jgi:hypothetical protein
MPLIDVKCKTCEHIHEVMRPLAMFPATPPCPDCASETEQIHLPTHMRSTPEPVIIFKAPDGTFRFPGDGNGVSAKNYERQGFERLEIRGAVEMRRFEQRMNKHEYSKMARTMEERAKIREENDSIRAANIRHGLQQGFRIPEVDEKGRATGRMKTVKLSRFGEAVMRAAQANGGQRKPIRTGDPGFYSEAYSMDRSNRDESRDAQGRRRRD